MIEGAVVGVVIDNVDPDKMHRIKVEYPVQGAGIKTTWCRMMTPVAGRDRGLVMLPEIDTEVVMMFAYRSLTPYVIGGVYNGAGDPDPYANADGKNNLRLVWTRGNHQVVFDDTSGAETLGIGACATGMGDVKSAPVYQHLDAANKVWTEFSEKDITWEAVNTISIKCKTLSIKAQASIKAESGKTAVVNAGQKADVKAGSQITTKAEARTDINGGAPLPAMPTMPLPPHSHPPTS